MAKARKVGAMDESIEVKNICDWVNFQDRQNANSLELDDGTVLTHCFLCRSMYTERNPSEKPPCNPCQVNLIPGCEAAARIFMLCRRQIINVWDGESNKHVDLNHLAVWAAIDHDGSIVSPYECFLMVIRVFNRLLKEEDNIHVNIAIDGKEIGNIVAKQMKTNSDLRQAIKQS
jgi:hypothetical protein